MKKLTFILICALFAACGEQQAINLFSGKSVDAKCEAIETPMLIGIPLQMKNIDGKIIITDFQTDPMITVFDPDTKEIVSKIIRKGRGPKELFPPLGLHFIGDSVIVHSRDSHELFYMPKEAFERQELLSLNLIFEHDISINTILPLTDSTYLASGTFEEDRFRILDKKGNTVRSMGVLPSFYSKERDYSNRARSMYHQTFFDSREDGTIAAFTPSVLEIYDSEINLKKQILLANYRYDCIDDGITLGAMESAETIKGALEMSNTNNYIYILFSNKTKNEREKLNDILVFDWEGNAIKRICPDKDLKSIMVESDNLIYGIDSNLELVKIKL